MGIFEIIHQFEWENGQIDENVLKIIALYVCSRLNFFLQNH